MAKHYETQRPHELWGQERTQGRFSLPTGSNKRRGPLKIRAQAVPRLQELGAFSHQQAARYTRFLC